VDYARLKLPARAPALVSLALPPGSYNVEPQSLGYFNKSNEFVYTADEPRGMIFARSADKVTVVELQAPARAEDFMTDYLQRIRESLATLNTRENELLQARQRFARASGRAKQLASIPLSLNSLDLAQGFDDWTARCATEGPQMLSAAQAAVAQSAAERDELKRLFYETQKADIELALRTYDLQMALARLPKPRFATVLGGDRGTVHEKTLGLLESLRRSWLNRKAELENQQRMDVQWLSAGAKALPQRQDNALLVISNIPQPVEYNDSGLRQGIQQARLSVSGAELGYLGAALATVERAIEYVDNAGVTDGAELPRLSVTSRDFEPIRVSELGKLTLVESAAVKPAPAAGLLLDLARIFEQTNPGTLKLTNGAGLTELQCAPSEVAYGLLIVDRCRRSDTLAEGRPDGEALAARLDKILEQPADFEATANDLGYLAFMRWYTALDPEANQDTEISSGLIAEQ
jgi:hypothetical protein